MPTLIGANRQFRLHCRSIAEHVSAAHIAPPDLQRAAQRRARFFFELWGSGDADGECQGPGPITDSCVRGAYQEASLATEGAAFAVGMLRDLQKKTIPALGCAEN